MISSFLFQNLGFNMPHLHTTSQSETLQGNNSDTNDNPPAGVIPMSAL